MSNYLDEAYRLDREDAELYVELVGNADAPAVFYLHGGPGYNSHSFRELVGDELSTYRMIYADQRGAGRSLADTGADLSVSASAADAVAILDALRVPEVSLVAHGFGAIIAAALVARAPERVQRLIFINPWVDMPLLSKVLLVESAAMTGQDAEELSASALTPADQVSLASQDMGAKALFDRILFRSAASRMRLEHTDAELYAEMQESIVGESWQDIWELRADLSALQAAKLPTVAIFGRHDPSSYPSQAELLLSALPHAYTTLLDAAHYPWLDDGEAFMEVLTQALKI